MRDASSVSNDRDSCPIPFEPGSSGFKTAKLDGAQYSPVSFV